MANVEPAYYFTQNGRECGPISTAQIKRLIASGKLRPSDVVRRSGTSTWVAPASLSQQPTAPPPVKETYDLDDELL